MLDHLFELLLSQLAKELFIEDWDAVAFLLLGKQLLERMLVLLGHVRDSVKLALLGGRALFLRRLFPGKTHVLDRC